MTADRPRTPWLRSGLGRRMDFRLVSNRIAVAVPVLAGSVAGVWGLAGGASLRDAVSAGVAAGGASFLGWATGRELDPDHPGSSALAAVGAPWLVVWGGPSLAAGGLWLLALRALSGTTGAAPYPPDLVVIVGLGVVAARGDGGLPDALAGFAVVGMSTVFERRARASTATAAVAGSLVAVAVAVVGGALLAPASPDGWTAAWLAVIALAVAAAWGVRVTSSTDRRPQPLQRSRVRWSLAAVGAWGVLAVIWNGPVGVAVAGPALVALASVALGVVVRRGR
jgi:hypothetical protein